MLNNDVLRSLRYSLDLGNAQMADIFQLGGLQVAAGQVGALLKKDDEDGFQACADEQLAGFLDGLVCLRRGKDDSRPPQPLQLPLSNNLVLKKLRVAFELKEDDLQAIMHSVDFPVSRPELSALFRKSGHGNYRPCGDQFLRNFLRGLSLRLRG